MPTLNWIGKEKVVSHHRDVPFRVLEHKYGFTAEQGETQQPTGSGNMIIHGDNLEALKALLPEYEGKVKCIYIDPPYNTGNEGWAYNDNVNHPKIKKWLDETLKAKEQDRVAAIGVDDLTRHDKWLCMMYPRLKLLHRLLAKNGAIFISIDDNEQAHLKLICDEIFGEGNFLGNICWQKKQSPQNDATNFSDMHDFVVVYAKRKKSNKSDQSGFSRNLIPKSEKQLARYKNPDSDSRGRWVSNDCTSNKTKFERPNLYFSIVNPHTGKEIFPPESTVWRFDQEAFNKLLREDRIYFGKDGKGFPRLKLFLQDVADGVVPSTIWLREFAGDNQLARRTLRQIIDDSALDFSTPKPPQLIERVLQIATDKNSIILDSFAGSGTTAHAVLNLNKQDGGNRKFILVEMEDYAETITAERVKRVARGYGSGNKAVEGTGGSFDYYELGQPLFVGDNKEYLNEAVGLDKIREYIWYSETRSSLNRDALDSHDGHEDLLGNKDGTAYYFYYRKDGITTLDHDFLATIKTRAGQYVIYADNCLLPEAFMNEHNIVFKKIPRDIARF